MLQWPILFSREKKGLSEIRFEFLVVDFSDTIGGYDCGMVLGRLWN
jgi:hypothetical protein